MNTEFELNFNEEYHEYELKIIDGCTVYSVNLLPSELKKLQLLLKVKP